LSQKLSKIGQQLSLKTTHILSTLVLTKLIFPHASSARSKERKIELILNLLLLHNLSTAQVER
jgi:hypothetical protein